MNPRRWAEILNTSGTNYADIIHTYVCTYIHTRVPDGLGSFPEASRSFQKLPEASRSFRRNFLEPSQKVHEASQKDQEAPRKVHGRYTKLPRRFRKPPQRLRKLP
jgi:hypothetical protein